jgi:hypothetical protein
MKNFSLGMPKEKTSHAPAGMRGFEKTLLQQAKGALGQVLCLAQNRNTGLLEDLVLGEGCGLNTKVCVTDPALCSLAAFGEGFNVVQCAAEAILNGTVTRPYTAYTVQSGVNGGDGRLSICCGVQCKMCSIYA